MKTTAVFLIGLILVIGCYASLEVRGIPGKKKQDKNISCKEDSDCPSEQYCFLRKGKCFKKDRLDDVMKYMEKLGLH